MNVKDLQARQGKVDITLKIEEKEEPRSFSKFGKEGRVCNCSASDETGKIKVTLWNEQVDLVHTGDTIKITNGYVGEWQGELQLSTGKFGQLEVVEKGSAAKAAPPTKLPKEPAPEDWLDKDDQEMSIDEERIE